MVLESIFAILIGHALKLEFPSWDLVLGVIILTIGVTLALKLFERLAVKE